MDGSSAELSRDEDFRRKGGGGGGGFREREAVFDDDDGDEIVFELKEPFPFIEDG